jgi:hypothetical protein
MPLSSSLRFKSERFDYSSDLPAEYNAGNRFYGRDVAQFLSADLTRRGFTATFLDEDWGWLVTSTRDGAHIFEVAIYNLAGHGEGGRPGVGEWGLWVRAYEKVRVLGLFSKHREVSVPAELLTAVEQSIGAAGATPEPWDDTPE